MQSTSGQSGNQNGQKQSSLSWSQPPQSSNTSQGSAKPISQVSTPPVSPKSTPASTAAATNKNNSLSTMKNPSGNGRMVWTFLAGVVVGLIIGWGWFSLGDNTPNVAENNNTETPTTNGTNVTGTPTSTTGTPSGSQNGGTQASPTTSTGGTLVVGTQTAGNTVTISDITVTAPTWVAVMDNNNGKPGNALGAVMFFPGQRSGTVELLRATVSGRTYFVGQYVDNGDHQFSKQADTQVNNVAGTQMLVQFSVR
jgi:hypothetical protein